MKVCCGCVQFDDQAHQNGDENAKQDQQGAIGDIESDESTIEAGQNHDAGVFTKILNCDGFAGTQNHFASVLQ